MPRKHIDIEFERNHKTNTQAKYFCKSKHNWKGVEIIFFDNFNRFTLKLLAESQTIKTI